MKLKQSKPNGYRAAHAPYNFVSLPEDVVHAREPLAQNTFKDGLSGRIHCKMTVCSPTYVRGMLKLADFERLRELKPEDLIDKDKEEILAPFFHQPLDAQGNTLPSIPGSSLRGMLRSLVEIISYSRIRWVSGEDAFFFRCVAGGRRHPLYNAYTNVRSDRVMGGIVRQDGRKWFIQPAPLPGDHGFFNDCFFKVEDSDVTLAGLPGFIEYNDGIYSKEPLFFTRVSFDAIQDTQRRIKPDGTTFTIRTNKVSRIGLPNVGQYQFQGWLVCSGNMMESDPSLGSPRRNHAVILDTPNPGNKLEWIEIDEQAVKDHLDHLSDQQKIYLGPNGCLVDGRPVFFVKPAQNGQKVVYFGHSPNFRIPARTDGWTRKTRDKKRRASSIRDFIPPEALGHDIPDLADAIFGWTEDRTEKIGPRGQRRGRVSVSDAVFQSAGEAGIWFNDKPQPPHILAGPKPSAFQHYLVQDESKGHSPDDASRLAHYGTSPDETRIRGHKRYWPQGSVTDDHIFEDNQDDLNQHHSQYTRVTALNPDVVFEFDVHFHQLREEELGALCWALQLPGDPDKEYCHRVGMGKPLGMGVVRIEPELILIDRAQRYKKLFDDEMQHWFRAEKNEEMQNYIKVFEAYILGRIAPRMERLADLYRIQELLTLTEWKKDVDNGWISKTSYMSLEDFKQWKVLPDPLQVQQPNGQPPDLAGETIDGRRIQKYDILDGAQVTYLEPCGELAGAWLDVEAYTDSPYCFIIRQDDLEGAPIEEDQRVSVQVIGLEPVEDGILVFCKQLDLRGNR